MRKYTLCIGLVSRIRTKDGIAPINGPKNGITFVTPTMTETSIVYGIFIKLRQKKQSQPMMRESMILPTMNPPKTRLM